MKRFVLGLIFSCASFLYSHAAIVVEKKETLLRLPLLSQKNSIIIANALDTIQGIQKIEACYIINVMIIGYDNSKIKDDSVFLKVINSLEINTTVEKIFSSDIPVIRNNYKITTLRNKELKQPEK